MRLIRKISNATIESVIGDYYVIKPSMPLSAGESISFEITGSGNIRHESYAPSGFFITAANLSKPIDLLSESKFIPFEGLPANEMVSWINTLPKNNHHNASRIVLILSEE